MVMAVCEIKEHEVEVCPKKKLACPNMCGKDVCRFQIESHINRTCPLQIVPCPFSYMGCETRVSRAELGDHVSAATVELAMLNCQKVRELEAKNGTMKKTLNVAQQKLKDAQQEIKDKSELEEQEIKDTKEELEQMKQDIKKTKRKLRNEINKRSEESHKASLFRLLLLSHMKQEFQDMDKITKIERLMALEGPEADNF